ncbi:MAG: hypothetical protein JWM10_4799 [Myxococcaceae bacterium]|nr:hypothetical protein [Myxococcaceae bacterium]
MIDHPSIDALQAHLDVPDPLVRAHLDGCADCARRSDRLAAGLAVIDEARRHSPALPAWDRLDEVLAREAQTVSVEIRAGRLRPSPRVPAWVSTGFAIAAGVGLLLGGRALLRSRETPAVAPIARRVEPVVAPTPTPTLTPYEGVVLLAAGGARYRAPATESGVPLSRATGLREGASVETPEAGRAVFTVRSGWTADVRSGSAVELSQLRTEQTAVTLGRGEVALTPTAGEARPVRVLHEGWAVESHGPVLARLESTVMRVVVLAGRTDIRRGDGQAMTVTGPLVVDLPLDGGAPVRSELTAADRAALDLAALSAAGTAFEIPSIDPTAMLTLMGHGVLPSSLESIRLMGPGVIQARIGRSELRLELGGSGTPRWAAFRSATAPVVAMNRVNPIAPEPAAVDQAPGLSPEALRAVSNATARRIQHCFLVCIEQNRCRQPLQGDVVFGVSNSGRASVSAIDPSAEGARRCVEAEAQGLPGLRTNEPYDFRVRIGH